MQPQALTRRTFIKDAGVLAAPILMAAHTPPLAAPKAVRSLKVICVGGHPDDPESGCGGTLSRYAELGHSVTVVYLTRGERGIRDKALEEAAKIRSEECERACKIMGAKPVFFGQIDGATEMTRAHVDAMSRLLSDLHPEVLFTHWPIDTHMDHQVASLLAIRACMALPQPPHLYFFEVNTGSQSQGFFPDTYVDVTPVLVGAIPAVSKLDMVILLPSTVGTPSYGPARPAAPWTCIPANLQNPSLTAFPAVSKLDLDMVRQQEAMIIPSCGLARRAVSWT